MKRIKESAYEAYTNSDLIEGRGRKVTIAYFKNEIDAIKATKGKGVMGTDARAERTMIDFIIFDSFEEYENKNIHDKVKNLNLTEEEIEYIKNNM